MSSSSVRWLLSGCAVIALEYLISGCSANRGMDDNLPILVTEEQNARSKVGYPSDAAAVADTAVTRGAEGDLLGPVIKIERPEPESGPVKSQALTLTVTWTAQGDTTVDLKSLRVRWVKGQEVNDLTDRILKCQKLYARSYCRLNEKGLKVEKWETVPPVGTHRVVMEIADSKGRRTVREWNFELL